MKTGPALLLLPQKEGRENPSSPMLRTHLNNDLLGPSASPPNCVLIQKSVRCVIKEVSFKTPL